MAIFSNKNNLKKGKSLITKSSMLPTCAHNLTIFEIVIFHKAFFGFSSEIAANSSPKLLISENLTGQEEIVHPMTINQSQVSQNTEQRQRKWSTFLQKPTNPVPDLKKDDEDSISVWNCNYLMFIYCTFSF